MDFLPDGRMVLTTAGDVSAGGWVPNPESGEVFILGNVTGTTSASQVTYTKVAERPEEPDGHPGHRRQAATSPSATGLTELLAGHRRRRH